MRPTVLTPQQIDEFSERGWTHLRTGFSREVAARCRELLWQKLGLSPHDRSGWTRPFIHMEEEFAGGP